MSQKKAPVWIFIEFHTIEYLIPKCMKIHMDFEAHQHNQITCF